MERKEHKTFFWNSSVNLITTNNVSNKFTLYLHKKHTLKFLRTNETQGYENEHDICKTSTFKISEIKIKNT